MLCVSEPGLILVALFYHILTMSLFISCKL